MNLLIPYVYLYDHDDPLFNEFTYGDIDSRAKKLKTDLKKGDYVFFHTSIRGQKYITAYYVVEKVLDVAEAIKDRNITAKYKNPHILEFLSSEMEDDQEDAVIFGNPITSRVLDRPLPFDRALAEKLSLGIKFRKDRTEAQTIVSSTRAWRELTEKDVKIILKEIKSVEQEGVSLETVLSTDEVVEIVEKDLEKFIEKNTSLIGKNLKLIQRQKGTPVGTIDLLYEDKKGNPIIVELKLDRIGRKAVNQIKRYMNWAKKETKKNAKGAIVCKGVMPTFEEEFQHLKDISILRYGWQLKVYKFGEN